MKLSAIVAMSQNQVIGIKGELPWKLSEDLKRFKQITMNHPVIMGRKTYESIGRPLPHRTNVIISRQLGYQVPGATVVSSVREAIQYCERISVGKDEEVFVIGGSEIYQLLFSKVRRIYLTLIHRNFEGDAFFPEFNWGDFEEVKREDREEPMRFSFLVLERKN